jgi:phosphatidate cytidylyltransferase
MLRDGAPSLGLAGDDGLRLRARVASSVVLAPAAIAATWAGGPVFSGLIAAAGVILAREWTRMSDPAGGDQAFAMAAAGAAGGAIAAAALQMPLAWTWIAAAALAAGVERARRGGGYAPAIAAALGVVYVSAPCAALVWLRLAGDGAERVTYLFACVWAADTGAFLAGTLIGGPRLLPSVSPKKTWAGLAAGTLLAAATGGVLAGVFAWPGLAAKTLGAAVLGVAALAGDLLESALKRRYGVKDAGALIPGHGGLLDRVDGLMLAAVAHATKVWIWP